MESSKKQRWTLTGLIVMVILNIGLVVSIWIMRPPIRPSFGPPASWEQELNLTPQQSAEFRRLIRERENTWQALRSDIRFRNSAYFTLLRQNDTTITPEELDSLVDNIQRRYLEVDNRMFEYFGRMRQVLDEEQQVRFDNLTAGIQNPVTERSRQMGREEIRRMFRRAMGRGQ